MTTINQQQKLSKTQQIIFSDNSFAAAAAGQDNQATINFLLSALETIYFAIFTEVALFK